VRLTDIRRTPLVVRSQILVKRAMSPVTQVLVTNIQHSVRFPFDAAQKNFLKKIKNNFYEKIRKFK
jgi:hypothetical protein